VFRWIERDPDPILTEGESANNHPAGEKTNHDNTSQMEPLPRDGHARSGICYEPGDSLAVIPENDPALVDARLARLLLTGDEEVKGLDGSRCAMREVLEQQATITKPSRRLPA